MSAADVHVRPAAAPDEDAIHRILVSAFGVAEDTEKCDYLRRLAQGWRLFLVLERAGEPVGVLRIQPDRVRLGAGATLLKGDVGYVGIRRDLHAQGLGTTLMRAAVAALDERGFALSRLGGLNVFYARFGYVPFPRLSYEFSLGPIGAGAATLTPEEFLRPSPEDEACLRPYTLPDDWDARGQLYHRFSAGHTGALVQEGSAAARGGGADASGLRWVYSDAAWPAAYAFASLDGESAEIHDAAGDPARPRALGVVIRRVLWEAARRGARTAIGRLPFDLGVQDALMAAGVPFVLREVQSAPASNMLLLVSLRRFVEDALPQWNGRLRDAGGPHWHGLLHLRVCEQGVPLLFTPEGIALVEGDDHPDLSLVFPARAFLLGALGLRGWEEIASSVAGRPPRALVPALAALFRRAPVVGGALG